MNLNQSRVTMKTPWGISSSPCQTSPASYECSIVSCSPPRSCGDRSWVVEGKRFSLSTFIRCESYGSSLQGQHAAGSICGRPVHWPATIPAELSIKLRCRCDHGSSRECEQLPCVVLQSKDSASQFPGSLGSSGWSIDRVRLLEKVRWRKHLFANAGLELSSGMPPRPDH